MEIQTDNIYESYKQSLREDALNVYAKRAQEHGLVAYEASTVDGAGIIMLRETNKSKRELFYGFDELTNLDNSKTIISTLGLYSTSPGRDQSRALIIGLTDEVSLKGGGLDHNYRLLLDVVTDPDSHPAHFRSGLTLTRIYYDQFGIPHMSREGMAGRTSKSYKRIGHYTMNELPYRIDLQKTVQDLFQKLNVRLCLSRPTLVPVL